MRLVFAVFGLIALAACGGGQSTGGGVGFSTGPGAASPQSVAAVAPTSAHDRQIATVKPRVLAKMRAAEPVKVYQTSSNLSRAELASLSKPAQDAIVSALPRPSFWTGYASSHVGFRAGLVGGQVARIRVNGQDFGHLLSGTYIPRNRDQIYALIAYRTGCKWNGQGTVISRGYPNMPGRIPTWFVGLSC